MKFYYYLFLTLLVVMLCAAVPERATAQKTSQGTDFWFGFMDNDVGDQPQYSVFISSDQAVSGNVSIPLTGWELNFSVDANSSTLIQIPYANAYINASEAIVGKAIHVTTNNPANVFLMNHATNTTDGSIVLPTSAVGKNYVITDYPANWKTEFLVVANQDDTHITIVPSANLINGNLAGNSIEIILNQGQLYQVKSNDPLTGSQVYGTNGKVFSVFAGVVCANVPPAKGYCNHLVEQMYPVNTWRSSYVVVPFVTKSGGSIYRVVALRDNTNLYVDGNYWTTINARQCRDTILASPAKITANRQISIAEFGTGAEFDSNGNSDPFMIMLSPLDQTRKDITFHAYEFPTINQSYLNVVARTAYVDQIMLNGASIGSSFYTLAADPTLAYAQIAIPSGTNRLVTTADTGFNAYVYGYGSADGYGYSAGVSLDPLTIDLVSQNVCYGKEVQFGVKSLPFAITSYSWNFGDDSTSTEASPRHVYANPGYYRVKLKVLYTTGDLDSAEVNVGISAIYSHFTYSGAGCNNFDIECVDKSTVFVDNINQIKWFFGDGYSAIGPTATHKYAATGTYTVTQIALSNNGCTDTSYQVIKIFPLPNPVILTRTKVPICQNDVALLDATNPGFVSYEWSNGEKTPTITTGLAGNYTVTVTDTNGCVNTSAPFELVVLPLPEPVITPLGPTRICACDSVQLDAGNLGYVSYLWNTGETTRIITTRTEGRYFVTVTDTNGCSNSSAPVDVSTVLPTATISLPQVPLHAEPGQIIRIPIKLTAYEDLAFCKESNFSGILIFNNTILVPHGATPAGQMILDNYFIPVTGQWNGVDSTIATLEFEATLGQVPNSEVVLADFNFLECPFPSIINNSVFGLDSLCNSGDQTRLYFANGLARIGSITPNPVGTENAQITFILYANLDVKIYITNSAGAIIASVFNGNLIKGTHAYLFDASDLASGSYFVVLEYNGKRETKKLEVVR